MFETGLYFNEVYCNRCKKKLLEELDRKRRYKKSERS